MPINGDMLNGVNSRGVVLLAAVALVAMPGRAVAAETDAAFLDDLQRRTFDFFWETAPADNGLTPDRWPSKSASSIAAVGFGLTAYCVGVERGWVDRAAAAERTLATLRFFAGSVQGEDPTASSGYRGFYYHFLKMDSGQRWRRCELSSIDTALLMLGVLAVGEYFDGDDPSEAEVRRLSEELYRRVEWDWMQPRAPLVAMGWKPAEGFGRADYRGYNEALFLYILAIGSPTHAIDPAAWTAFTDTYEWAEFYGQEHVNFEPLFGHQYAACWIDLRGIQDPYLRGKGIDYFENSRRATLAQREYAIDNPGGWRDYGPDVWGLTACDGPTNKRLTIDGRERRFSTYKARGASAQRVVDDGTIAPTAAGGSIAFTPEHSIRALRTMRDKYGDRLYSQYGFRDAFNPTLRQGPSVLNHGDVYPDAGWFDQDYLGIDQGPILLMAENHRTGFVWELLRKNEHLRRGLRRAGFTGGWLEETTHEASDEE